MQDYRGSDFYLDEASCYDSAAFAAFLALFSACNSLQSLSATFCSNKIKLLLSYFCYQRSSRNYLLLPLCTNCVGHTLVSTTLCTNEITSRFMDHGLSRDKLCTRTYRIVPTPRKHRGAYSQRENTLSPTAITIGIYRATHTKLTSNNA